MKLKCSLIALPSAVFTFSAKVFNGSCLSSISSYFSITRTAPCSSFVLIIFEFVAAHVTRFHIYSIAYLALPFLFLSIEIGGINLLLLQVQLNMPR